MNTKRIIRRLRERFGGDDGFFLLETAAGKAASFPSSALRGEGWEALCRFLEGAGLSVTAESLCAYAQEREEGLARLFRYPDLVPLALLFCLSRREGREGYGAVLASLRLLGETEGTVLAEEGSEAGRLLLSLPAYALSDLPTRAAVIGRVVSCAKKRHLTECDAVRRLAEENALFQTAHPAAGALYFPLLYGGGAILTVSAILLLSLPLYSLPFLYLPLVEAAKRLTDLLYARFLRAEALPRLDGEEIPETGKTLAVITLRLSDPAGLGEKAERAYLCNRSERIAFGLLCDLPASDRAEAESDTALIAAAESQITALNRKYGARFYLFVRGRVWDESEQCFLGYERKRGAILELTRLLRGEETSFRCVAGDTARLCGTRFLITLDEDTGLPPGAAKRAVMTLLHPFCRAKVRGGAVREGYGVLQPRSEVSLSGAGRTVFSRFLENGGGTSVYADPAFELYQTVFGTGIFCGKGILDLAAYGEVLDGTIPEDRLLSHDLVEGAYLRCGYLSDTVFTDSAPTSPASANRRSHRWMRGDVQALWFAGGRIRDTAGNRRRTPLSALSRYQLFDNLRRLLTPVFAVSALLLLPGAAAIPALLYLFLPLLPVLLHGIRYAGRRFFSGAMPGIFHTLLSCLYEVCALGQSAYLSLDALLRALWRMKVSHRHLLAWQTAGESERKNGKDLRPFLPSLLLGLVLLLLGRWIIGAAFLLLLPLSLLLSAKNTPKKTVLTRRQRERVTRYAEAAWRFYESSTGKEDRFLPPDNIQSAPVPRVAHRTSPTNIGLYLLSCLSAADLGFLGEKELCDRVAKTLSSVRALPAWKGHLYNWYDTRTARPLGDPYVSSVDSGNFVLCLTVLAEGLREYLPRVPALSEWITLAEELADRADFAALYDKKRERLRIGIHPFREDEEDGCYDLYLSEARMTVYYAIARGQIPPSAWRALSRIPVGREGRIGLASWSGTMFEALLPALFLPVCRGSLAYEALCFCLHEQRKAGTKGIWGKSESGYAAYDTELNYQYRAFGVASCALRPGQEKQLVYAPYAAFLALPFEPRAALSDLARMEKLGLWGAYGFYEAIDFTPGRAEKNGEVVRSYMAHHTGMVLLSCLGVLRDNKTVTRAMRIPYLAACADLLGERIPVSVPILRKEKARQSLRSTPPPARPKKQPLSVSLLTGHTLRVLADTEGRMSVEAGDRLLTADPFAGGRLRGLCLWGKAGEETFALPCRWEEEGDALIARGHHRPLSIRTEVRIIRGPTDLLCIRTLSDGSLPLSVLLTFEPVLGDRAAHEAHPAFSDLSVESSFDAENGLLFFRRRSGREAGMLLGIYAPHLRFETSRDPLGLLYGEKEIAALASSRLSCTVGTAPRPFCAVRGKAGNEALFLLAVGREREEVTSVLLTARLTEPKRQKAIPPRPEREAVSLLLLALTHGTGKLPPKERMHRQDLWECGISGDLPILCITLTDDAEEESNAFRVLCRLLIAARVLWMGGVRFDLAILLPHQGEYGRMPAGGLHAALLRTGTEGFLRRRGGIFPVVSPRLFPLLRCVGRCDLPVGRDTVMQALWLAVRLKKAPPPPLRRRPDPLPKGEWEAEDGAVRIRKGDQSAPWSFPLANPAFGTLLTQNSLGYTWYRSCQGGRLTPWDADPMEDMKGELLLLREGGRTLDLIALSTEVRFSFGGAEYRGEGYSVLVTVDARLPVKCVVYRGENAARVSYCLTPVLGGRKETAAKKQTGTETLYESRMDGLPFPVFLREKREDGFALFLLGVAAGGGGRIAERAEKRYSCPADAEKAMAETEGHFLSLFAARAVGTGEDASSRLLGGYLPYQTLVSRLWARTGFYQSGGAYGFRDQLQDVLALLPYDRRTVRAHILRAASHQYTEGDVMHWWHPGLPGKGIRTRCSDDLLFLPYAAAEYAAFTGDGEIWKCRVPYLSSPPLAPEEWERYETAVQTKERETLLLHCLRALKKGSEVGQHSLPLIGTGDWNDGMNRVGEKGQGESVWLAFFRVLVIEKIVPVLAGYGYGAEAEALQKEASALREAWEHAYESGVYRRGYYDDGAVLGGMGSDGRVFLLPQAFAAILGAKHGKEAMENAYRLLWDSENGIFRLFTPPFSQQERDAGYIRAYCEGVRENGGQYTHGALWGVWGLCAAGMYREAWTVFRALLPTEHAKREVYRVEPYFAAADISTAENQVGRGGWTLYTGSAGWTLRILWEVLLGMKRRGREFTLSPVPGMAWKELHLTLCEGQTLYRVLVTEGAENRIELDGKTHSGPLFFDKKSHDLRIYLAKS